MGEEDYAVRAARECLATLGGYDISKYEGSIKYGYAKTVLDMHTASLAAIIRKHAREDAAEHHFERDATAVEAGR